MTRNEFDPSQKFWPYVAKVEFGDWNGNPIDLEFSLLQKRERHEWVARKTDIGLVRIFQKIDDPMDGLPPYRFLFSIISLHTKGGVKLRTMEDIVEFILD